MERRSSEILYITVNVSMEGERTVSEQRSFLTMGCRSVRRALVFHATTAVLFTKSDIKTTLVPVVSPFPYRYRCSLSRHAHVQTVFAIVVAPLYSLHRLPHVVFWIWLHVLQFDTSNQTVHPQEDACNKADRPLPSGRITLRQALILRWFLVPSCIVVSSLYSMELAFVSTLLLILTIVYNELHAADYWCTRNVMNGLGTGTFELGATLVAGEHFRKCALDCSA